jgi:hypothetical protein
MILENYTPALAADDQDLQASPDFLGEGFEFTDLTVESLSEMHNLTIALARVEHKCLVESNDALLEGAVSEFFKKTVETIKAYWAKFVAWLGSMWTKLKDVFVKREDWLKRNASIISSVGDDKLKDMKATLGSKVVSGGKYAAALEKSIAEAGKITADVKVEVKAPADEKPFLEKAREALIGHLAAKDPKATPGARIHSGLVGESKEVDVNKALVGRLLEVAKDTFDAMGKMAGAKMIAAAAVKSAEGFAVTVGGDKAAVNAKFAAIRAVGSEVQTTIAAYASALAAANGQAMPVLVKVAALAGKEEKKPEAAAPAAEIKKEDTDILAAFM